MDQYKEYPIRCKTCNYPIAVWSKQYEQLIQYSSTEDALNELGLNNFCCRISMLAPPIITFNMENRKAIEGLQLVENVDSYDNNPITKSKPLFKNCIGESVKPSNLSEFTKLKSVKTQQKLLPDNNPIKLPNESSFINTEPNIPIVEPVTPGIPTINKNSRLDINYEDVGNGVRVEILSGRTYLAR